MGFPRINCFNDVLAYDLAIILFMQRAVLHTPNFRMFSGIVSVMHERATHYHWRRDVQLLSTSIEP